MFHFINCSFLQRHASLSPLVQARRKDRREREREERERERERERGNE